MNQKDMKRKQENDGWANLETGYGGRGQNQRGMIMGLEIDYCWVLPFVWGSRFQNAYYFIKNN